ncbi:MAG: hypothetical protein WC761_01390 [Candidatus Paceibacterota bacterium]|jgi:hypothetical protein
MASTKKFSVRKFRKFSSPEEMLAYAHETLPCLGKGSSRTAFAYSRGKVLKISADNKGFAQNAAERFVANNLDTKMAVSAIYDHKEIDGHTVWLISQIVRVIKNYDEFENLAGFSWEPFNEIIREFAKHNAQESLGKVTTSISNEYSKRVKKLKTSGDERNANYFEKLLKDIEVMKVSPFFLGIIAAMEQNRLMPGDILEVEHYGKTSDGNIVLLDYGLTEEIANKYYKKPAIKSCTVAVTTVSLASSPEIKTVVKKKRSAAAR